MPRTSSLPQGSPGSSSSNGRRQRQRASLRVRNVAEGVVYHLVFEGDIRRLSGRQLRHHLAQICHIPPSEQHLVVHGSSFSVKALGADVGLGQDDTVELYYGESAGAAHHNHPRRDPSAATASSLRPSTDAGTMSPAPPEDEHETGGHYARTHTARYEEAYGGDDAGAAKRHVPPLTSRPGADRRASVGSTATSNSRRVAPSPDRLVERHGPLRPQEQQQQQRRDEYWGAAHDDSQLPPSTTATTMSSLYTGRYGGGGGEASPHPHIPSSSAHRRGQHQQLQQQRPSYEVPSPYERRPPRRGHNEDYVSGAPEDAVASSSRHYDVAGAPRSSGVNGLNHSRREPVYDGSRSRRSGGHAHPSHVYEGSAEPHHSLVAAPAAFPTTERTIPIRADDLEALLDEQDYIWRMEDYRFRTERLNRLSALQNRQRELAFEAARYDQAVAVVASQLSRERRKLAELQEAMTHHSASLGGPDGYAVAMRRGKVAAVEEEEGYEDGEEEVIEVGV